MDAGSSEHQAPTEAWDEIHQFKSPAEFQRFTNWLTEALRSGDLTETEVGERYSGATVFDERWFRAPSGQLWRVVAPDPPFQGIFTRVTPLG